MRFWPVLLLLMAICQSGHGSCEGGVCRDGAYIGSWGMPLTIHSHSTTYGPYTEKQPPMRFTKYEVASPTSKTTDSSTTILKEKTGSQNEVNGVSDQIPSPPTTTKPVSSTVKTQIEVNSTATTTKPTSSPNVENKFIVTVVSQTVKTTTSSPNLQNRVVVAANNNQTSPTKLPSLQSSVKPLSTTASPQTTTSSPILLLMKGRPGVLARNTKNSTVSTNQSNITTEFPITSAPVFKPTNVNDSESTNNSEPNLQSSRPGHPPKYRPWSPKKNEKDVQACIEESCECVPVIPQMKDFKWSTGQHCLNLEANINLRLQEESFWCKVQAIVKSAIQSTLGEHCKVCKDCGGSTKDQGSDRDTTTNKEEAAPTIPPEVFPTQPSTPPTEAPSTD